MDFISEEYWRATGKQVFHASGGGVYVYEKDDDIRDLLE